MENKSKIKVMITGANGGIGRAIAEAFAAIGADMVLCVRKETEEFENFVKKIVKEQNVNVSMAYFDLGDSFSVEQSLKKVIKENRDINVLVNNAAVSYGTSLNMMSIQKIRELFEINFFEQLYIIQMISKLMIRNSGGSIINIASVSGMEAYQGNLAYGSSKAALIYATKVLSKELASYGIRVNAVAPGTVETNMMQTRTPEQLEEVINRTAMKRMAQPEEIAEAVVYLAGEGASYITGQVLVVDGGRMNV